MFRFATICAAVFATTIAAASTASADQPNRWPVDPFAPTGRLDRDSAPPALLTRVQHDVMAVAQYVPDPPGRTLWRATTRGDCKDLALEMHRRLRAAGISRRAMRILVTWRPDYRQWHAALLVRLDGHAWLLDSLRRSPILWDGRGVEFQVGPHGRRVVAVNGIAVKPTPWRQ